MSIFLDFNEVYKNEFVKRNSGASFYKYLDDLNADKIYKLDDWFIVLYNIGWIVF